MTDWHRPPPHLRIVILGAGGIGCYYGARLIAAGHSVTFVARGAHLAALKKQGLLLEHPEFLFQQPVDACDLTQLMEKTSAAQFDAIIICVKATETQNVAQTLSPWFKLAAGSSMIISLQNGVDNEAQLADKLGDENIVGGLAVRIGGHIISPAVVKATGVAEVVLGPWPDASALAQSVQGEKLETVIEAFNKADIPTRRVDNIRQELWRKLVINNGVNPLSALTRLDTRTMSHHPRFGRIVRKLMQEAASVAIADGETLTSQDADEMFDLIRHFDPIKTSMLVDLENNRPLEIDQISGAVLQRAKQLNKTLPYTETVYALLQHQLEFS